MTGWSGKSHQKQLRAKHTKDQEKKLKSSRNFQSHKKWCVLSSNVNTVTLQLALTNYSVVLAGRPQCLHSKKKKHFRAPFLVLQVVTNRELYSAPGRTMIGILGSRCTE